VSSEIQTLARRREYLIARAAAQRAALHQYHRVFEGPVRAAELMLGFGNTLRRSPLFVTALAAVLVRTPWRRLARLPKWVWRGWRALQFVRSWAG
jgi:hypothetical protein